MCEHRNRTRYTWGFICADCGEYFPKECRVYKETEGLRDLWCSAHNYYVQTRDIQAMQLRDDIGIHEPHSAEEYERFLLRLKIINPKLNRGSAEICLNRKNILPQ